MSFDFFVQATSRLYWPFLLSSAIVALLYSKRLPSQKTFKYYLTHSSTRTDVLLFFLNSLLKVTFFIFIVGSAASFSLPILRFLRSLGIGKTNLNLSVFEAKLFLTIFVFILSDFLRFSQHLLMHHLGWFFHKVHHSAQLLTPLTLFRTHPIESLISYTRNTLTHALTIIVMVLFFDNQLSGFDFLGVNIFGFLFNASLSNLRHSPIPISFGYMEYLFISPRMHQVHHSKEIRHHNKNYGVALSVWDQMVGSFYRPSHKESECFEFGISQKSALVKISRPQTLGT
jgi:sterol desaturase/sphingolipid hydroxylase (fatty acid hydroxylase superfamily)